MDNRSLNSEKYIQELEDKIVELSLDLKATNNNLKNISEENFERLQKLIHNLKNPIGIAFSFSEIIKENSGSISKESLKKYNEAILNSTEFSVEMLNELAVLNRLKSSSFLLKKEMINYGELINSVIEKNIRKAAESSISIEKCIPNFSLLLNVDEREIEMVLDHIFDNSIKFSNPNSTIQISVIENQNFIETAISDQGIGISANNLPSVFKEFFVANTYAKNSKKCIGLGLSISKQIIDFHKGTLIIESKIDAGTTVKIALPRS